MTLITKNNCLNFFNIHQTVSRTIFYYFEDNLDTIFSDFQEPKVLFDAFKMEIITTCGLNDLDDIEKKMIIFHKTLHPDGYNLMKGGNSNKSMSDETKQLIIDTFL